MTTFNSGFGQVFLDDYFIGIFAAPVLMGIALWRSRSVPRWLAVLFLISLEVAQQVQSKGIVVVLFYTLLFAVAMVLLWRPDLAGGCSASQATRSRPSYPRSSI